jgi:virginiamycin B lyase
LLGAFLWSATASAQSFHEFPVPTANSDPIAITFGPDANLWFTEFNGNRIANITSSGAITEFPTLPLNPQGQSAEPDVIVRAPDGALYFTMANESRIGRITTNGTTTFCNTPTNASGPNGITIGSDGNLWFTEIAASKIGMMILSTCTITEFPTTTANSRPARITLGPDGNMWFTESQTAPAVNKIGRITPQGAITEFPVTTPASEPWGIRGNYDGNIWFTERAASKIGVINTNGVMVTETSTPTPNSDPVGLNFGPDGHLWFTERQGNNLARIGGGGGITEFPIPTAGSQPGGLIVGPDGALWFTEEGANQIGRFEPLPGAIQVFAAVLPTSRSPQVGNPETVFATIVNAGPGTATACRPQAVEFLPLRNAGFQTTDPTTNQLTGSINTPADIPQGGSQSFVLFGTPNSTFPPTDLRFGFACSNANAAPIVPGLNTLLTSASTQAVPDVIALAATPQNDGILHITGSSGTAAFATATDNVGGTIGEPITAAPNTGGANLPLNLTICQSFSSGPQAGQCMSPLGPSATTVISSGGTPTFSIFGTATGAIAFTPQTNRINVDFSDSTGAVRGATSIAVETQ